MSSAFQAETFESAFRSGVDLLRLNQLLDDLEVEPLEAGLAFTDQAR